MIFEKDLIFGCDESQKPAISGIDFSSHRDMISKYFAI